MTRQVRHSSDRTGLNSIMYTKTVTTVNVQMHNTKCKCDAAMGCGPGITSAEFPQQITLTKLFAVTEADIEALIDSMFL